MLAHLVLQDHDMGRPLVAGGNIWRSWQISADADPLAAERKVAGRRLRTLDESGAVPAVEVAGKG